MDAIFRRDLAKSKRDPDITQTQFTVALRRLLLEFRTDKKGRPGKFAKQVGYRVAGNDPVKQTVLSFLIETRVIKWELRQYVVNKGAMKELSLSMHALARLDENNTNKAYVSYCLWRRSKT